MELSGARIVIRPWQRHDDEMADKWPPYNDPLDLLWNLPRPLSFGTTAWEQYFDSSSMRRSWAVDDRAGHLIGRISLREIDERKSQARLGITFGAPYVGQGLGTQALILFMNYYFSNLGFRIMVLDVAAPNERAVRCYERLGFSYIGSDWREAGFTFDRAIIEWQCYRHLRQFFHPHSRGVSVEFFEMRLLREEWLAHQIERAQEHRS